MERAGSVRAWLEAAGQPGGGLDVLLRVAWDGFGVLADGCRAGADRSGALFAAFSFACVAAAQGRLVLWAAPSLPPDCGWGTGGEECVREDEQQLADELAGLVYDLPGLAGSGRRCSAGRFCPSASGRSSSGLTKTRPSACASCR